MNISYRRCLDLWLLSCYFSESWYYFPSGLVRFAFYSYDDDYDDDISLFLFISIDRPVVYL